MSYSLTGDRAHEQPHAFLGMGNRHEERMYAVRMLLFFWAKHPDAVVYIDGQTFHPTDEELAEAEEPRKPCQVGSADGSSMPEALVSASVEIDKLLHEEDEPRRASVRETLARARARKTRAKPAKKKGGLRAMMRAGKA